MDVIGVGGINFEDQIARFSSRGMTTWVLCALICYVSLFSWPIIKYKNTFVSRNYLEDMVVLSPILLHTGLVFVLQV